MSKHHKAPDTTHHGDKTHQPEEPQTTTAQNLLNDAQGRWLDKNQPDAVNKLVQDGVLPEGSKVIDFGKVSGHLDADRKSLDQANAAAPIDTTGASKALDDAKAKLPAAQKALDAAQQAADAIQNRVSGRINSDRQVQNDFDTISKDTKDTYFYASNLKDLAEDKSKSQEVRDAASRLLGTFHKQGRGGANSEYATTGFGAPYIDQGSITSKAQKDNLKNDGDVADFKTKSADRDKAKDVVDGINSDISGKDAELKKQTDANKQAEDSKTQIAERIKREEDALKPNETLADLGKVTKGGGYYQVAERLLGLDHKRHSNAQERELKMMTRMLQDEERKLHGGHLPKSLRQNDALLKPENMAEMLERVRKIANPDT